MNDLLKIAPTTQFKKDLKKIAKQGKNRELINNVILKLRHKDPLSQKNYDHSLVGIIKVIENVTLLLIGY